MTVNFEEYAKVFKAVSDPKRLQILDLLSGGELCACKILERFSITQPTLSHDMKLLHDAGLVSVRRDGKWNYYTLNKERLRNIQEILSVISEPQSTNPSKNCCR